MLCAVVVPTYRRPDLLARCLDALSRQSIPSWSYEVIVVDDAADPAAASHVATLSHPERSEASLSPYGMAVRYIPVTGPNHGPAAARNQGWRATSAPIIAFTDDDTVPDRNWLAYGIVAFDRPRVAAVTGRTVVPVPPRPTDYERDTAGLEGAEFVTANCFVRRSVLEQLGGFDENFRVAWREDSDLHFRLLAAGHVVATAPEAVVVHPIRPAPWGVSLKQQQKASFDALLYKKHPELYSRHIRPSRPRLYYLIVAAGVGVFAGMLMRSRGAATLAAAVWVTLTLAFALRRLRGTSRSPAHLAEMILTSALIPPLSLFWRLRGGVRHRVLFW